MLPLNRRQFLAALAATTLVTRRSALAGTSRFGPLQDAGSYLRLPAGFRCRVLQRAGEPMADGRVTPSQPDGMACFLDGDGNYVLIINRELGTRGWLDREISRGKMAADAPVFDPVAAGALAYDSQTFGGVTRLVLDAGRLREELSADGPERSEAVLDTRALLIGTEKNCAGGVARTALGEAWITCEETLARAGSEDREQDHGWAFYVPADLEALAAPDRLDALGRFKREAVARDRRDGNLYMTEDHEDGCLYRFVPVDPEDPRGGGALLALKVPGLAHSDSQPVHDAADGASWEVEWVRIEDPAAAEEDCLVQGRSAGATAFNRLEGVTFDGEDIWFVAALAGPVSAGQVYRLRPTPAGGRLTLVRQVRDRKVLSMPDNLTMTPWGDLLIAEDNYNAGGDIQGQHLRCLTPGGDLYELAFNRRVPEPLDPARAPGAEFAGPAFSPDGRVLFVNLQTPEHVTLAISGPWGA